MHFLIFTNKQDNIRLFVIVKTDVRTMLHLYFVSKESLSI